MTLTCEWKHAARLNEPHGGDEDQQAHISSSAVFAVSSEIPDQSSWRNLSQWIHPGVLPGLPYTSGTIVSCSRKTLAAFGPRWCG
ncbi:cyclin-dependent kinase 17-like isoform X1 [Lates japonicus]|uniref:Cyclin-dependent kinase 17-like isoform X1 n=1 Tax=Lates japonicus TaxID=270547 RepID=A0AAD3M3F6_LATJO|nr:cyclin-dependent kinase 17-like isoform X1 [Lates japonicus]